MPRLTFPDFGNHSGAYTLEHPIPYVAMDVAYLRPDARQSYFVKPGDHWVARRQPPDPGQPGAPPGPAGPGDQ